MYRILMIIKVKLSVWLRIFILKLEIKRLRKPSKNLCLRYGPSCTECRIADRCLAGRVISEFGAASGLLQTISYIEGSLNNRYESLPAILEKYYT